jgi:hypothetical protein
MDIPTEPGRPPDTPAPAAARTPPGATPPTAIALAEPAAPARAGRRTVWLIAAVAVGIELAVSGRYGYHRDELYFLECGRHLALGYVDQPALTPLLARLESIVFDNALVGLRVIPALCMGALVLLTSAMARLLGAGATGRVLGALSAASCLLFLAATHLLSTTTPSLVLCALVLYLVMRLLDRQDPRGWIAVGLAAGVAAEAKWDVFYVGAALAAGFLVTRDRRLLRSRFLVIGLVIAAVIAAPDFIWQAQHGWPQLAVFASLNQSAGSNRISYWPSQILYASLPVAVVCAVGMTWSLRSPAARPFRPVAIAAPVLLVLLFVLGGKSYYPDSVFTFLIAAGCVPVEGWIQRGRARRWAAQRTGRAVTLSALIIVFGLFNVLIALPVVPPQNQSPGEQKLNYTLVEMLGWPRLVGLVAREYDALPAAQRRHTALLTANYGEAGAIDRYGPGLGLPAAYSGHNSFWFWGPPPAGDTTVVAVNIPARVLRRDFTSVRRVATFWNGLGISDQEQGAAIYVASGLKHPWAQIWRSYRHYD